MIMGGNHYLSSPKNSFYTCQHLRGGVRAVREWVGGGGGGGAAEGAKGAKASVTGNAKEFFFLSVHEAKLLQNVNANAFESLS